MGLIAISAYGYKCCNFGKLCKEALFSNNNRLNIIWKTKCWKILSKTCWEELKYFLKLCTIKFIDIHVCKPGRATIKNNMYNMPSQFLQIYFTRIIGKCCTISTIFSDFNESYESIDSCSRSAICMEGIVTVSKLKATP